MVQLVNGNPIHYERTGQGTPLILLHGNGEDLTIFREAVQLLRHRFTVYALDLPGHGESYRPAQLHYDAMARDVLAFIRGLGLEKPCLYGFSDGGIIGLLLACNHPGLLSKLVVSGANLEPKGLMPTTYLNTLMRWRISRCPKAKLMLTEPSIPPAALSTIAVPTFVTAGQFDCIRPSHTRLIAASIPGSRLDIFPGQLHGSYVVHSRRIGEYLLSVL